MKEYDFTLKFQLCNPGDDPDNYIEKLGGEGCDDALIGVGKKRRIALKFTREDSSQREAINSAIADVKRAIPEAVLVRE
jgi:hypothetical protein